MDSSSTFAQPSPHFLDFVIRHARVGVHVCTRQKHEIGYRLEPRTIPDHNLIYITRGRVVWMLEGKACPLVPGDLMVCPPGVVHYAYSQSKQVTFGSIHVDMSLPGGQDVFDLIVIPLLRRVKSGSKLDQYFRMVIAEWDRPELKHTIMTMSSWARLLTLELIVHDAAAGQLRQRPMDPLVAEMLAHLNQRLGEPTTLGDLSKRSGFSPQHLNRVFHRLLGVTPLQYLARMRMERAAALLAEGKLTSKAIAAKVGFDDPYYFSRQFKQHFGRSPSQYRDASKP